MHPEYPPDEFHCYTDGSLIDEQLGFSLAIITFRKHLVNDSGGGFAFKGYRLCTVDTLGPDSVPLASREAKDGEHLALCTVLRMVLNGQFGEKARVIIHVDCQYSIMVSQGFTFRSHEDDVENLLSYLGRVCRYNKLAKIQHIKAHNLHPWNEFVDILAKEAARGGFRIPLRPFLFSEGLFGRSLSLWFVHHLSPADQVQFPDINRDGVVARPCDVAISADLIASSYTGKTENHEEGKEVVIKTCEASANVLTLLAKNAAKKRQRKENKKIRRQAVFDKPYKSSGPSSDPKKPKLVGLKVIGRTSTLQKDFYDAGATFIGIQEARTEGPSRRTTSLYHIVSGGSAKSGGKGATIHGCEAWVAKVLRDCEGNTYDVKPNHITLVYSDPRRLFVTVVAPFFSRKYVVLHAPSPTNVAPYVEWLEETSCLLASHGFTSFILTGDLNSDIVPGFFAGLGHHQATEPGDRSQAVSEFLYRHGVVLPSTFAEHQCSDIGKTWVGPKFSHRYDYVGITADLYNTGPVKAWVSEDVCLSFDTQHDDHKPVFLSSFAVKKVRVKDSLIIRRLPEFDPSKLREPDVLLRVSDRLNTVPAIPWEIEQTSHGALLDSYVRNILREEAPATKPVAKPLWMSQEAKNYSDLKSQFVRQAIRFRNDWRWHVKAFVFRLFKFHRFDDSPDVPACIEYALDKIVQTGLVLAQMCWYQAQKMHGILSDIIARDKNQFLEELLQGTDLALSTHELKKAYAGVRRLYKFVPQSPQSIVMEDGTPAKSPHEVRYRWLRHWEILMHGLITNFRNLVVAERATIKAPVGRPDDPSGIPDVSRLQSRCSKVSPYKACGENAIPNLLLKLLPYEYTMLTFPLHLKSSLMMREPLLFKGNCSHELRKPKVDLSRGVRAFRGIGLPDENAKISHKETRSQVVGTYEKSCRANAHGGLRHRGVDFASHTLHTIHRCARANKKSSAFFFVDLVSAFDNLDNSSVFGNGQPDGYQPIVNRLLGDSRAIEIIKDSYNGTWTCSQGIDDVVCVVVLVILTLIWPSAFR